MPPASSPPGSRPLPAPAVHNEPAASADGRRCPRCGGAGAPPRRQRSNPFLTAGEPLLCGDCGLDFEEAPAKNSGSIPPW